MSKYVNRKLKRREDRRARRLDDRRAWWDEEPEERPLAEPRRLFRGPAYTPRTDGQARLCDAIDDNDIVFSVGPAGTGKTFLAVAKAVEALEAGDVSKVVFVRPCVGVGRTSGFLPGDLEAKVSPFLRPLLDELGNFYPAKEVRKLIDAGTIELASLEYARGRTFKHAFVVLDEAQNATEEDLDVFLSRLGEGSKYVIAGDLTRRPDGTLKQCDLPPREQGAFEDRSGRYGGIDGIATVVLGRADIVRHPLVRAMIERDEQVGR